MIARVCLMDEYQLKVIIQTVRDGHSVEETHLDVKRK